MFKRHPNLVLTPNLPDRGVKVDLGWLKSGLPADELAKLESVNYDRPTAQFFYGIQARNLAKLNAAGVRIQSVTTSVVALASLYSVRPRGVVPVLHSAVKEFASCTQLKRCWLPCESNH